MLISYSIDIRDYFMSCARLAKKLVAISLTLCGLGAL